MRDSLSYLDNLLRLYKTWGWAYKASQGFSVFRFETSYYCTCWSKYVSQLLVIKLQNISKQGKLKGGLYSGGAGREAYNRNFGLQVDGSITGGPGWYKRQITALRMYTFHPLCPSLRFQQFRRLWRATNLYSLLLKTIPFSETKLAFL